MVGEVLMLFPAEPSHVGLVPLQFSKTNKVPDPSYPSLAHYPGDNGGPGGYEERPRQRRSERPAVEEYGGRTGREGELRNQRRSPGANMLSLSNYNNYNKLIII